MNWLRQIRVRFRSWRDNREAAALLSDIEYHKRAECWHRTTAWRLTQEWREQQRKAALSPYAQEIQRLCNLRDLEEAERIGETVREAVAAWGIKPANAKQAEELAHNILYLDRARRDRRDRRQEPDPW